MQSKPQKRLPTQCIGIEKMNKALIKILFIVSLAGLFSYLVLLKNIWLDVSQNPDATLNGFIMNYVAQTLGGTFIYLVLPAIVWAFKGRSFERYIISVFIIGPILYYFTIIGATS